MMTAIFLAIVFALVNAVSSLISYRLGVKAGRAAHEKEWEEGIERIGKVQLGLARVFGESIEQYRARLKQHLDPVVSPSRASEPGTWTTKKTTTSDPGITEIRERLNKEQIAHSETIRQRTEATNEIARLLEGIQVATKDRDEAYTERNHLVALVARVAPFMGMMSGVGEDEDPDVEPEWRTVVFVDLPTGQVSWHVHEEQKMLFVGLPKYQGRWDHHNTIQKYERVTLAFR